MARPFQSLLTKDVFRRAKQAVRAGDEGTITACVAELRERRNGEELIESLDEMRLETHDRPAPSVSQIDVSDAEVVAMAFDGHIVGLRKKLIEDARSTLWISTFTIKDEDEELQALLKEKRRSKVKVNVVVSLRPSRQGHGQQVIEALKHADVGVKIATNHTKCLIADGEHVLVGSANIQAHLYRDLMIQLRSRKLAKTLAAYLDALPEAVER